DTKRQPLPTSVRLSSVASVGALAREETARVVAVEATSIGTLRHEGARAVGAAAAVGLAVGGRAADGAHRALAGQGRGTGRTGALARRLARQPRRRDAVARGVERVVLGGRAAGRRRQR